MSCYLETSGYRHVFMWGNNTTNGLPDDSLRCQCGVLTWGQYRAVASPTGKP